MQFSRKAKRVFKPIEDSKKKKRSVVKKRLSEAEIENLFDKEAADKLISSLNKEQKESALSENTHNLVIASAGTGKTSTITARVVHLIQKGTHPKDIMLITFTSKAADEMRERIKKYVEPSIANELLIGTFHSTAISLLKENNIPFNLQVGKGMQSLFALSYNQYTQNHRFAGEKSYEPSTLFDLYSVF